MNYSLRKREIDKFDFIEIQNFSWKDIIKKRKRQDTNWERISINRISDKGFESRIYKELSKFNNNKYKSQ